MRHSFFSKQIESLLPHFELIINKNMVKTNKQEPKWWFNVIPEIMGVLVIVNFDNYSIYH